MEIIVIRHGQSLYNVDLTQNLDSCLTDEGVDQAKKTGFWLKENFDLSGYIGFTSPYLRALQTSREISSETGLKFSINHEVREYHIEKSALKSQGGGMPIPNRSSEFYDFNWDNSSFSEKFEFYETETLDVFIHRINEFLQILDQNGKYVIVSHGAPTRVIYEVATNSDLDYLKKRYSGMNDPLGWPSCNKTNSENNRYALSEVESIKNSSVTWITNNESKWFSKVVY